MKETLPFVGGHPRSNNDIQHLNDAILQNAEALAKMLDSSTVPVILYGMQASQSGSNYNVTAGACVYQGELFFCDGGTISGIPGIKFERELASFGATTYPLLGTNKDVHTERVATVKSLFLSDFNLVNSTFKPKVKTLQEVLKAKLTNDWQTLNFQNSFRSKPGYDAAYYYDDIKNELHFKGRLDVGAGGGNATVNQSAFELPTIVRPSVNRVAFVDGVRGDFALCRYRLFFQSSTGDVLINIQASSADAQDGVELSGLVVPL